MMLQRSYNFLNLIRDINCCHINCLYTFQIRLQRRHVSVLITPKYSAHSKLCVISNSQKIYEVERIRYFENVKWTFIGVRALYEDSKSKKEETRKEQTENTSKQLKQRIIELNEEKLGKLKERVLDTHDKDEKKDEKKLSLEHQETQKTDASKEPTKEDRKAKKRPIVERPTSSLERNFITPLRAMSDFLLRPSDLENLPKTKRRSPYESEPPITVFWRKDVEAKAVEVHGSYEVLAKERLKREMERKTHQQNLFTIKRKLRNYRKDASSQTRDEAEGLFGRSGKVVLTAVAINASNFLFKLCAWIYTGSHSMFSECIHSLADTCNQLILVYGIHKSVQNPNPDHPYGYTNMRFVSSLISGVSIFCIGTGLSLYHGVHGLLVPEPVSAFFWAYFILGGSLVSEGATLLVAINSIRKGAEERNETFRSYVFGGRDPSVTVVLLEDLAAVLGIGLAAAFMGLTSYFENPMYDAFGSILVGALLGGVATFLIQSNVGALLGRSIPQEHLDKINAVLESDIMVRGIHDVKGIDMGNNLVRYKAEIDFDGRELTRSYLDKHDLKIMLEEVKSMKDIDEFEAFLLKHGESIVDMVGGEIDRIELKLKKIHPEIRHCDLEIL